MSIWEVDKLILFIAFVIPGFISIKAYELYFSGQVKDSSKQIVDAITYSCINYALLSWLILSIENSSLKSACPTIYNFYIIFVLFIAPIVWVYLWKRIRESKAFQKNAPHPIGKPWDYVFSKGVPYWVKVTLKDGTVIGGKYAYNSFASSSPHEEQIYLEETWVLNDNGGFIRAKNNSSGVIILTREISHVELREYKD